ncbi:cell wall hydrolase [Sphingomonas jaspsi]|uniref:cell wall hydrolase n=1 Tax=Sphingomonas jaspsi TaxID=392409 RepID=UPI001FDF3C6A|nr:cell wall hydrolase [Sphingomonas jaspsi]
MAATLTASSVAPAQVRDSAEPLIQEGSGQLPVTAAVVQLPVQEAAPAAVTDKDSDEQAAQTVDRSDSLADMVAELRASSAGSRELECLAGAIYFESKSESLQGQLAVGHVIANRASSGRFPSSYCGVVYQRSQFSFVRGGSMPYINKAGLQYRNAVAIAKIVDQDLKPSPVGKALFFHARRVSPGWHLTRVSTVGNHVFYR